MAQARDWDTRQHQSHNTCAPAGDGISLQELIEHAHDQEFIVTARQIERWHKEDILPRPQLQHIHGVRGSRSTYPAAAADQLIALCRLDASGKRFSSDEKRLMLWLQGFAIPLEQVRQDILGLLARDFDEIYKHAGIGPGKRLRDTLKAAEHLAKLAWPHLQRVDLGHLLRQRIVNPSDIHAYLVMEFQLLLGGLPAYAAGEDYVGLDDALAEKSLESMLIDVYGLTRAQTDRLGSVKPWLPLKITPTLIELAQQRVYSIETMRLAIEQATPDALNQARLDRKMLFSQLFKVVRGIELVFGDGAFGLGIFHTLEEMIAQSGTSMLALQVAGMLVVRRTAYAEALDQIAASIRELLPAFEHIQALHAALERELPEIAAAMRPDPEAVRQHTDHTVHLQERLNRLQELAEQHCDDLARFRDRHPELFPQCQSLKECQGDSEAAQRASGNTTPRT